MKYIADLHIHSKYSRATARNSDLENLYISAQIKGITVLGTGDYTHPAWFAEISERLEPAEPGLYRLKPDIAKACDTSVPAACRRPVRFVLSTEISSIYKKNGVTRKNHNLVFMPDLASAARFNERLDAIGNITADGRPILGLDARNLLEIALETTDDAFLIPAHIWTPWFSLFGSKSGFDSMAECFEDLTPHIFALETGLSSDPPMNWRIKEIDGLTLVSNSDAHSPANLGREANIFDTDLSYTSMRDAMKTGDPKHFLGTYEFYPEEGKYHYDGHRNCSVVYHPREAIEKRNICPVCGKPLTLGVLHRVEALATRPEGEKPVHHHPFFSIVPLPEMLSEILGVGVKTKKVTRAYNGVLEKIGSEFDILYRLPEEEIRQGGVTLLDTAVARMRSGDLALAPGYDGEYGKVRIFKDNEMARLRGERSLFAMPAGKKAGGACSAPVTYAVSEYAPEKPYGPKTEPALPADLPGNGTVPRRPAEPAEAESSEKNTGDTCDPVTAGLNSRQLAAVMHGSGPMMIVAGPGSGKTRTITCRIARLIKTGDAAPAQILAITFTNRAAGEMRDRIAEMAECADCLPFVATFHAFCLDLLKESAGHSPLILDETDRLRLMKKAVHQAAEEGIEGTPSPARCLDFIATAKQQMCGPRDDLSALAAGMPPDALAAVYRIYQDLLNLNGACDYEDLLVDAVRLLEDDETARLTCRARFAFVFVDEYQDLNYCQYRLIQALVPPDGNICVIGDPDQAIYGFRGSDAAYFDAFERDFPAAERISLERNYRSTETILSGSYQVISRQAGGAGVRVYSGIEGAPAINVARLPSEKAEAVFAGKTIETMMGGLGFHSVDFGKAGYEAHAATLSFSDFAILFRTRAQGDVFAEVLAAAGIPCHRVSKTSIFTAPGTAELLAFLKLMAGRGSFLDFEALAEAMRKTIGSEPLNRLMMWCRQRTLSPEGMLTAVCRFPVPGMDKDVQRKIAELAGEILDARSALDGLPVADKLAWLADAKPPLRELIESSEKNREAYDRVLERAAAVGTDMACFFDGAVLAVDADGFIPGVDRVMLMTMHAAKGLEFPVVFIAGCEDGYVPYVRAGGAEPDMDEERRLFYVAMTRAREHLFLTAADRRMIYGKRRQRQVSPFVEDIQETLKAMMDPDTGGKKKKGPVQLELF
ncbi:MAG: UvrD-helicase domain-containing protein [Thermodesulfobacteriota bacterium]|nr:UvrD-helicase domain-containing protein [Thermodesulfobacteriota bacterium]